VEEYEAKLDAANAQLQLLQDQVLILSRGLQGAARINHVEANLPQQHDLLADNDGRHSPVDEDDSQLRGALDEDEEL